MIPRNPKRRKKTHSVTGNPSSLAELKNALEARNRQPECIFGGQVTAVYAYNTVTKILGLDVKDSQGHKARVELIGDWANHAGLANVFKPTLPANTFPIAFDTTRGKEYRAVVEKNSKGLYKVSFGGAKGSSFGKIRFSVNNGAWRNWAKPASPSSSVPVPPSSDITLPIDLFATPAPSSPPRSSQTSVIHPEEEENTFIQSARVPDIGLGVPAAYRPITRIPRPSTSALNPALPQRTLTEQEGPEGPAGLTLAVCLSMLLFFNQSS